jgi:hypothetical protein
VHCSKKQDFRAELVYVTTRLNGTPPGAEPGHGFIRVCGSGRGDLAENMILSLQITTFSLAQMAGNIVGHSGISARF